MIGRDASTGFAGTETLPVVTAAGHTLSAEAILALGPTRIPTDTTIGPKEVRQQPGGRGHPRGDDFFDRRIDTAGALVTEVAGALGVPCLAVRRWPRGSAARSRRREPRWRRSRRPRHPIVCALSFSMRAATRTSITFLALTRR